MTEITSIPTHVGFILDGNRRWAKSQGLPTLEGHRRGYDNLKDIAKTAFNNGVKYVSAYIFSTENWNRTKDEVKYLMDLALRMLTKDLKELNKENIRVVWLGTKEKLSHKLLKAIENAEEMTKNNSRGTLALCFNYGGHTEIVEAVRKLVKKGAVITDKTIEKSLYAPAVPAVDLIIRTSGEQRLSNFMLWRAAYSELYFTPKHWPEFTTDDLKIALDDYAKRQRRFGG